MRAAPLVGVELPHRPGVVLGYERNEATLAEMAKAGYRVVPAGKLLKGEQAVAEGEAAVM